MADFIDDEASEASSSQEEESSDEEVNSRRKKITKSKQKKIDDSSEEDEDDEEGAEEEMKDLINDEEEEEDEESSDDDGPGNKRSRDDDDDEGSSSLSEEDIDLIHENTGVRIAKKKKFKRIKKVSSDDDSEEEADEGRKIHNELFGTDLLASDDEDVNKERTKSAEQDFDLAVDDDDEDESDSDDNFIVDDNDQPINKKTKKKGARYADSAMQQAQEIFGVDFDFEDFEDGDDNDDEDDYEDDYEEGDESIVRSRKKKGGRKTIYDIYEPSELARSHLTTFDQQIKTKDEPERFQLRSVPVTQASEEEIEQEAEWIFKSAFDQPTISIQEENNQPIAGKRSEFILDEIKATLKYIRNDKLEVPFIAAYRREYVKSISSNFDDTRDLWTIYNFDELWCKLQSGKKALTELYTTMKSYLEGKLSDTRLRQVTYADLERVENIKEFHDLEDCRLHFQLYYSPLVTEMKLHNLEEKIKERKAKQRETAQQSKKDSVTENGDGGASAGADRDSENEEVQSETDKPDEPEEPEEPEDPQETEEDRLHKRLSKFRISSARDRYQRCRENYIGNLAQKFGLTPEQLGENLREDYQRNTVVQHYTRPLEEAEQHMRPGFVSKEAVLKAATYMYSREISVDPLVRQIVRKYYFDNAVINVRPTPHGMKEIDENHSCYTFRFLKNKPVNKLVGDQILHLINAEKDKLLEVYFSIEPVESIDPRNSIMSPYYESLKALYFSDLSSIVTKEWNDQREEAVRSALEKILIPCFEKQLREKLVKEAQDKIIKTCSEKLQNWLNVAPYAPANAFDDYEDFELRNGTRICGFTFAPDGDSPCFAAIVDSEGELVDHVRLPFLNIRKRSDRLNAVERENQAKDRAKFKQFILNRKPHAVALAAETIQTKFICQDLAQILDELREHDGLPLIPIEIVDNELSNVYINLKRATEEFADFPPLLLQAISNARKLNDPLSEYSKLCSPDDDILCIRFHTMQDELPKEEFLKHLQQKFITRTNAVGVDPNRAIAHPHTADLVQFVAGLGPRKGAHLVRSIKKSSTGGQLVSREQLIKELGMTQIIFMNCAGFIKLDTDSLSEYYPDERITSLDSTRIHPESYNLASKIASDALDYEEGASEETAANSCEEILECPEKLDDLDLKAFARELEEGQKLGRKEHTLQSIREEFQCRYKDHREPYKAPNQEEIFTMLTKETAHTFFIGKLITCQVVAIVRRKPGASQLDVANPVKIDDTGLWRCPFCMRSNFVDLSVVWNHFDTDDCPGYAVGVRCRLDNGLSGFVLTKFISDKEITDPSERVSVGQTIHARVIKIDTEKFSCDLTCRSSDLLDADGKLKPPKDDYYDEHAEKNAKRDLEAKSKRQARRPYCKRVIVHPAFENIDYKACEKKLAEMEQGHAIIRPSSHGQNFLTVSWKVADGVHQHVNIREEGKDNAFSLGHQLYIENESYEDLDEIIARYIQPMASYARELLNYKYLIKVPDDVEEETAMQEALFLDKRNNPTSFPYKFAASKKMPSKFLLGYLPSSKPRIEYLTVTPRGYRYRKLYFKNLASLIKFFKENWNKVPQVYPGMAPGYPYESIQNPMASLRQTFPMQQ